MHVPCCTESFSFWGVLERYICVLSIGLTCEEYHLSSSRFQAILRFRSRLKDMKSPGINAMTLP